MTTEPQPKDEWTFLRPDEFADDDAVDQADAAAERSPEVSAMHVDRTDEAPMFDPGRADVDTGSDGDDKPVTYFDDEQPDGQVPGRSDGEHEPDLEEILESQHYAFASEEDDQADGPDSRR